MQRDFPPCSYCGGNAIWHTACDNHWYCPAHLYCAQMKTLAWAEEAYARMKESPQP